jgi:hypothetical protein
MVLYENAFSASKIFKLRQTDRNGEDNRRIFQRFVVNAAEPLHSPPPPGYWCSELTAIVFLNSINRLSFVIDGEAVCFLLGRNLVID